MPSVLIKMQEQSSNEIIDNFLNINNDNKSADNNSDYCVEKSMVNICGGCGLRISDRFYLLAVDKQWHCQCLKCCHCGQQLESELTCFSRHGLIYCKQDYYRHFCWQKCVRCSQTIQPKQLVMRIVLDGHNSQYYHTDCFTCAACDHKLIKGDYFGRHNNHIYCRYHFQQFIDGCVAKEVVATTEDEARVLQSEDFDPLDDKKSLKSLDDCYHQKPRLHKKRKTKLCQKFIDKLSSLSKSSSPISSRCDSPMTPSTILSYSGMKRPKRNRTSFKHQQLRAMKQYFNLNHNPDSKDLKQLSQRTGLSKRVLQVWFQNQRAKWRRSLLRQQSLGPQIVEECQPLTELNEYPLNCDEEQNIIEEEQSFATYTHLY